MNATRITKDNTGFMNDRDKLNAIVNGIASSANPLMATSATAMAAITTIPDYVASGTAFNNTGATATLEHILPDPATCAERYIGVLVSAAQIMRFQPISGGSVYAYGSGVADKYLNIAGVIGNYAILYCDGTNWYVVEANGVVTKEA